jgi:hypothetical protein
MNASSLKIATTACLSSLTLVATAAQAATFVVNDARDLGDALHGDGACEVETGAGECTLRAAVQEANALAGPDEVQLGADRYELQLPGEGEDAAATGDLDVLDALVIRGEGVELTILDGAGLDRVIDVPLHGAATLTLDGLSLRGGTHGGLRKLAPGALGLRDCDVAGNFSPVAGGGHYATRGAVTLVRTTVHDNHALMQGGGIRIHGGDPLLVDSVVSDNAVRSWRGGGVHATAGQVTVLRSVVSGNVAALVDTDGVGAGECGQVLLGARASLILTDGRTAQTLASQEGPSCPDALAGGASEILARGRFPVDDGRDVHGPWLRGSLR